jgi:hypothetical protein
MSIIIFHKALNRNRWICHSPVPQPAGHHRKRGEENLPTELINKLGRVSVLIPSCTEKLKLFVSIPDFFTMDDQSLERSLNECGKIHENNEKRLMTNERNTCSSSNHSLKKTHLAAESKALSFQSPILHQSRKTASI